MSEWPAVMRLVAGVERPFNNTTTAGTNNQVLVIKGRGDFVLRSGSFIVCILFDRDWTGPSITEAPPRTDTAHTAEIPREPNAVGTEPVLHSEPPRTSTQARLTRVEISGWTGNKAEEVLGELEITGVSTNGSAADEIRLTAVRFEDAVRICEYAQRDGKTLPHRALSNGAGGDSKVSEQEAATARGRTIAGAIIAIAILFVLVGGWLAYRWIFGQGPDSISPETESGALVQEIDQLASSADIAPELVFDPKSIDFGTQIDYETVPQGGIRRHAVIRLAGGAAKNAVFGTPSWKHRAPG